MKPEVAEWRKKGCPNPPPGCIKHAVIRQYASDWDISVLIETGTFYGDTIFALRRQFLEIHSIELSEGLHHLVKCELAHEGHIHLHLGDSAIVLPRVAANIIKPSLYWLDGHFCSGPSAKGNKDTPISDEVDFLLMRKPRQDVILIDDARLFDGSNGYPTLDQLRSFVLQHRPAAAFEVKTDIVRIAPV